MLFRSTVVGNGHAEKDQVKHMVKILLPRAELKTADSTDALAIAPGSACAYSGVENKTASAATMRARRSDSSCGSTKVLMPGIGRPLA